VGKQHVEIVVAVSSDAFGNWDLSGAQATPRRFASARLLNLAMAAIATAVTLATTGFAFGVSNNVYHLPFVLRYAALPQFANDQFYQDLVYIVSFVWPLERLFATESNVWALFLGSYIAALFAYFFALLSMVSRLARPGSLGLVLAALLLGISYLDSGYSVLAGENIVGGYFTESQVATALITASLALAMDRRLLPAILLLGVAFDVQLEFAVWGLVALVGVTILMLHDGMPVLRSWVIGGPVALIIAAPAAVWFAHSIAAVGKFDGDYIDYLNLVEPNQWLVWTVPLKKWVLFGANLLLGFAAFAVLGPPARLARAAFVGLLCVFAIGCAVPLVTDNQWILNLRLMAADEFLQVLATAAATAVVVRDIRYAQGVGRVGLSIVVGASLVLSRYLLPIGALAMLARAALASGEMLGLERRVREFAPAVLGRIAAIALMLLLVAGSWLRVTQPLNWVEAEPQRDPGFASMINWVRQNTSTDATFLVNGEIGGPFDKFQIWSKRAVWLDDRRGASGMWDPRYYAFWKQRIDQLWSMHSPTERLPFSCSAGVDYYADETAPRFNLDAPGVKPFVMFSDRGYFIIDSKAYCAAHGPTAAGKAASR
jgi:hypothetical protein